MHLLPHVSISLLPYFVPTYGKDHSLSQRGEEGIHFLPCALRRISVRPPQEEEQLYSNIPGSQGRMVWEMLPAPPRAAIISHLCLGLSWIIATKPAPSNASETLQSRVSHQGHTHPLTPSCHSTAMWLGMANMRIVSRRLKLRLFQLSLPFSILLHLTVLLMHHPSLQNNPVQTVRIRIFFPLNLHT